MVRKFHDGKMYDTEKADEIHGSAQSMLYKSHKGQFFMVDYSRNGPEDFRLLTRDQTFNWLAEVAAPVVVFRESGFEIEEG